MADLEAGLDALVQETGFSGVVRVDRNACVELSKAYGLAHRGLGIPNELETRFGIASGTKGLTALTVVRLVQEGTFGLGTSARSLLGEDLPLVDDRVTVEHLLAQRSGIGDYLDEEMVSDPEAFVLAVPPHRLATTEDYLAVLAGHPTKFAPGERFAYSNGGYVLLALLAERATGTPFFELVHTHVCEPAALTQTSFPRSDEPEAGVALGYLSLGDGLRTNILPLPVRGIGDGGAVSTIADVHRLWAAFFAGRIVAMDWVREMTRPRDDVSPEYGLGFWLLAGGRGVLLEGSDAGISFRSLHAPALGVTATVMSNTTGGAWPVAEYLAEGFELGGAI